MKIDSPMEIWLAKRTKAWPLEYGIGALGVFAMACLALAFTFWLVYFVFLIGFGRFLPHSHETRLLLCAGTLVLIFIGNAFANRYEVESFKVTTLTGGRPVTFYIPNVGMVSNINVLSPETMRSFVRIWVGVVCAGPRLATEGVRFAIQGWRMASLNVPACAAILSALVRSDKRIPFTELAEKLPSGCDPVEAFTQVQWIRGVMVLRSEPPGLTLLSNFREELVTVVPRKKKTPKPVADPE